MTWLDFTDRIVDFRAITKQKGWQSQAVLMLSHVDYSVTVIEAFSTYWVEAGHHIRAQIDDDLILLRLLRHLLPRYNGQAIELFRGENRARWASKAIGLAWTPSREIARMFGRGLNAVNSGGVLLRAWFEPEAIVAGPNAHSTHLGESQFTVDPSLSAQIEALEFFPPIN